MANRFLETNYFKSPFVRSLKGSLKSLYSFIICDCTPSGIWAMDMEAASLYTGFSITEDEFEENFVKTGKAIPIGKKKYFFPDFIEHQYPKGLSEKNTAHIKVIPELKSLGLIDESNRVIKDPLKPLLGDKGIGIGIGNIKRGGGGKFIDYKNLIFTDTLKQSCLEILSTAQFGTDKKITKDHVENLFTQFCEIQKSSTEYYKDEAAIWVHFKRWLPKQKINGTDKSGIKHTRFNQGAHDLLTDIKSSVNSGRK